MFSFFRKARAVYYLKPRLYLIQQLRVVDDTTYLIIPAKGPSTNRFRPPIADLFRDGGRGLAFESAFKKKIRTKPEFCLMFYKI